MLLDLPGARCRARRWAGRARCRRTGGRAAARAGRRPGRPRRASGSGASASPESSAFWRAQATAGLDESTWATRAPAFAQASDGAARVPEQREHLGRAPQRVVPRRPDRLVQPAPGRRVLREDAHLAAGRRPALERQAADPDRPRVGARRRGPRRPSPQRSVGRAHSASGGGGASVGAGRRPVHDDARRSAPGAGRRRSRGARGRTCRSWSHEFRAGDAGRGCRGCREQRLPRLGTGRLYRRGTRRPKCGRPPSGAWRLRIVHGKAPTADEPPIEPRRATKAGPVRRRPGTARPHPATEPARGMPPARVFVLSSAAEGRLAQLVRAHA